MKKFIVLISLITLIISCQKTEPLAPGTYEITGTAKGVYNGIRVYLKFKDDRGAEIITDTAMVVNEMFSFKGKIDNSIMQVLTINSVEGNLSLILEPGRLNLEIYKDSLEASKVSGSENNDVLNVFKSENRKKLEALNNVRLQVMEARNDSDKTLYDELVATFNTLNQDHQFFAHDFIDAHPDSDFSLMLLESLTKGRSHDLERFKSNLANLEYVVNKNESNRAIGVKIKNIITTLEAQQNLEIGKIAPNFSSITPDGKTLALNDIKGKATIIDFWASWCKPCRVENPNVVKVYNKYREKGLEIISVSLDREGQKDRWLKAIEDDKMNWHHVSHLKFWQDPVAQLYKVTSIPATFILDAEGRIVAKGLRGDALEKQMAEMLD